MKYFICFAGLILSSSLLAQSYSLSTNFWNTFSVDNPAAAALNNQTEVNLNFNKLNFRNYYTGGVIFNQKVDKLKGGIGVNSTLAHNEYFLMNRPMVNYNYQWKLNDNNKLSFGGGIGFVHNRFDELLLTNEFPDKETYMAASIGVAFQGKKINAGLAYINNNLSNIESRFESINAYFEFKQKIGENFVLIPRTMFRSSSTGFMDLNLALISEYKNRYIFGLGIQTIENPYLTVGYRFNKGFSLNYSYVMSNSSLSNRINTLQHEFNVRFVIPSK
jgi:hypothetical protein